MPEPKTNRRPSADVTRSAILKAARKHFVKKGFAATSISTIAKTAKVNQSLIYHHFTNKENLWISVKLTAKETMDGYKKVGLQDCLNQDTAREFIAQLIQFRFDIFDQNPDIRRMIDWQFMETTPEKLVGLAHIKDIKNRIEQFQEMGEITDKYPSDLLISLILNAPLSFWRSHQDFEKSAKKEQLKAFKAQFCQLCIEALCQGLLHK